MHSIFFIHEKGPLIGSISCVMKRFRFINLQPDQCSHSPPVDVSGTVPASTAAPGPVHDCRQYHQLRRLTAAPWNSGTSASVLAHTDGAGILTKEKHSCLNYSVWHIEAWTKQQPFCRWNFQMHFLHQTNNCSFGSNWPKVSTGSVMTWELNRRQTIIWTNDGTAHWQHMVSLLTRPYGVNFLTLVYVSGLGQDCGISSALAVWHWGIN